MVSQRTAWLIPYQLRLFSAFFRGTLGLFSGMSVRKFFRRSHVDVEDTYHVPEGALCKRPWFCAHTRNSVTFEAAEIAGRRRKTEVGVINPETETARAAKKMACTDCKTHQNRHFMQVSWCPWGSSCRESLTVRILFAGLDCYATALGRDTQTADLHLKKKWFYSTSLLPKDSSKKVTVSLEPGGWDRPNRLSIE